MGLRDKPELQELVATTGVSGERIAEGVRRLQEVETARLQQRAQRGTAGDVRRQRNAAFQSLMEWMAIFRKVARAALATTPAYLATLGMEPQPGKKKKKTDEKKTEAKPAAAAATKDATTETAASNTEEAAASAATATTQSEAASTTVGTVLV